MKKITILCDNNTFIDQYVYAEPALSFLIETDQKKVLFDFGYSDVYLKNAELMNVDLNKVDVCVLSHGHNDHTGGMIYWNKKRVPLICHPDCIGNTVVEGLQIGNPLSESMMREKFDVKLSKEPVWITENLCFLGEIPTEYDFETKTAIGRKQKQDQWEDDYVMEDSALALKTEDGLWIVTGCSHAGICSIIAYAKKVTNAEKIAGVIGGFHLLKQDKKLIQTIHVLKELNVGRLIPTHCVNLHSKIEMAKQLVIEEAGSGMEILLSMR